MKTALDVFDKASLTVGKHGEWDKARVNYFYAPTHALLFRDIDFYIRKFDNKAVVFVFLHGVGGDGKLMRVLDSFRWQDGVRESVAEGDKH